MNARGMTLIETLVTLSIAGMIAMLLGSTGMLTRTAMRALNAPSSRTCIPDLNRLERLITGTIASRDPFSFALNKHPDDTHRLSWITAIGGRNASGVNDIATIRLQWGRGPGATLEWQSGEAEPQVEQIFARSDRLSIECLDNDGEWLKEWTSESGIPLAVRIRVEGSGSGVVERLIVLPEGLFP